IYAGVCTDSPAPDQKSGMAGRSSEDCPGGGDGSLVLVPYELVAIQDKLCLPEEGQAYAFLMENGAERHQLYTYLEDQNVPDDCTVDSPERLFGLEAVVAMVKSNWDFEQDYKGRMSVSERAIYDSMSRFKQVGYLLNAQKATWESEDLYPNSQYNGKGDAFRHAYFNGLNAILLGPTLAEDL